MIRQCTCLLTNNLTALTRHADCATCGKSLIELSNRSSHFPDVAGLRQLLVWLCQRLKRGICAAITRVVLRLPGFSAVHPHSDAITEIN